MLTELGFDRTGLLFPAHNDYPVATFTAIGALFEGAKPLSQAMKTTSTERLIPILSLLIFGSASFCLTGCHDGPMYALKSVNPYWTMHEWRGDDELGVTDHVRREQLAKLSKQIGTLPLERQRYWTGHLNRIMLNDPSAEMRRLVVVAASRLKTPDAMGLLEKGLDDSNLKVRMAACEGLGRRQEPQAAQLLASTYGTETDQDVRNAAVQALGNHKGVVPTDSLRIALKDQDPATADLAVQSLRGVTGQDYGETPQEWIAALDKISPSNSTDPQPPGSNSPEVRYASGESTLTR